MNKILKQFLEQEVEKSDAGIIIKINSSTDLEFIGKYTNDLTLGLSDKVKYAARKQARSIYQNIISETEDMIFLIKISTINYYRVTNNISSKIKARFIELLANITTLNALTDFHKNCKKAINTSYVGNQWIPNLVYDQMAKVAIQTKETNTFDNLFALWLGIREESNKENGALEEAMRAILEKESDVKLLTGKYAQLIGGFGPEKSSVVAIVVNRINAIVTSKMPTCESIEEIGQYAEHAVGDDTRTIVEDRIIEVITPKLRETTLDTIDIYRDTVSDEVRIPSIKVNLSFKGRLQLLLMEECRKITTADAVYPYIARFGDWFEKDEKESQHPAFVRFNELVPDYFRNNPNRELALEWWKETEASNLIKVITDSINKETDALLLAQSAWPTRFFAIASQRLKHLVLKLKEVAPWFENCIEKKTFMFEKDTFVKKARELAGETA